MKQMNKKELITDWKICLIALIMGLLIAVFAWCLTHLSFLLTWMTITIVSIPIWNQIAIWAKREYPGLETIDALFTYIFIGNNYDEDDDVPMLED